MTRNPRILAMQMLASASATVRADVDLVDLVDSMPVSAEGREAIWNVITLAYSKGFVAGVDIK